MLHISYYVCMLHVFGAYCYYVCIYWCDVHVCIMYVWWHDLYYFVCIMYVCVCVWFVCYVLYIVGVCVFGVRMVFVCVLGCVCNIYVLLFV